jgi:hypothetical protein
MKATDLLFILFVIALFFIGLILWQALRTPDRIRIYRENPPVMESSRHWGYIPRPWWRRYEGIPGIGREEPHARQVMPPHPQR